MNSNSVCGQRFCHNCYEYYLRIFTPFVIPNLLYLHLRSKYLDADSLQI